eukprot:TRINITY_DN3378_c0_g1_i1.p1 TRINITY_DN3378_c0_g1~~TRINITY_DN3378_c0_g1_i1.p1  ORF type:complete len:644 (-),score=45.39 TRINITY_DN3378_c0_g1_i1:771-2564(-)
MSPPQQIEQNVVLIEENVKQILKCLGEDHNRPGLVDTPRRVTRAWVDFLSGYDHKKQAVEMVQSALFTINDEKVIHSKNQSSFYADKNINSSNEELILNDDLISNINNTNSSEFHAKNSIFNGDISSNSSQNSLSNSADNASIQFSSIGDYLDFTNKSCTTTSSLESTLQSSSNLGQTNNHAFSRENLSTQNTEVENNLNRPQINLNFSRADNFEKQLIVVKDVEFVSISSEDLWPVLGKCHVGYVPGESGLVVGLSKIARICRCLSQRLTNQQQLLQQLISTIQHGLNPLGVAVLIEMQYLQFGGSIQTKFMVSYQGCFWNRSDQRFLQDFVTAMALHGIDTDLAVQVPCKNGNGHSQHFLSQIQHEEFPDQQNFDSSDDDSLESSNFFTGIGQNGEINDDLNCKNNFENLLELSKSVQRMLQTCIRQSLIVPQSSCVRYAERLLQQCTPSNPKFFSQDFFSVVKLKNLHSFPDIQGFGCRFSSMCEHHILPFYGKFWIITQKAKNFTLSACKELVGKFSCKLQMQERLTQQISEGVGQCDGVMVVCEAYHMCMLARGVQSRNSNTVTVMSRGCFDSDFGLRRKILASVRRDQMDF